MTDHNPYQSPVEIDARPASRDAEMQSIGMEFQSDWSAEGLRRRRKSDGQIVGDLGYVLLTMLWVASLLSAVNSPYGGLFCLLTPMWVLASIIWISNIVYRNGGNFVKKYAGLAGVVSGRVDGGRIRLAGPSLSIAARIRDCQQFSVFTKRAFIQPPGIHSSLPIAGSDIRRTWRSPEPIGQSRADPVDLLTELSSDAGETASQRVIVSGTVRGSDFRGQNCWHLWCFWGLLSVALGVLLMVIALRLYLRLPTWISDPPSHYQWSDADVRSLCLPVVLGLVSIVGWVVGLWHLSRTIRTLGRFSALITPDMIAIADRRVALGYHGRSLHHFQWTDRGIVVRDAAGTVRFLIPARWFDRDGSELASKWYARQTPLPERNCYIGPSV